jgi:hypothetical protein
MNRMISNSVFGASSTRHGASTALRPGGDAFSNLAAPSALKSSRDSDARRGASIERETFAVVESLGSEWSSEPVFIHAGFRTSSTWFFSRLRNLPGAIGFYEIFNPRLATIRRGEVDKVAPGGWNSNHPNMSPYYREYLPLIKADGGVEAFSAAFDVQKLLPADGLHGDLDTAERSYVESLIDHAGRLSRRPILSSTGALGRALAMRRCFNGCHILLYRNLFAQWCSFVAQAYSGADGFFYSMREGLASARDDATIDLISQTYPLGDYRMDDANWFYSFFFLHLYLYSQIVDQFHEVVDCTRLAADTDYRLDVEARLATDFGLDADLSSARNSLSFCFTPLNSTEEILDHCRPLIDVIAARAPSDLGRATVYKMASEFCAEHRLYLNYAGPVAKLVGKQGSLGDLAALSAEVRKLQERNSRLERRTLDGRWRMASRGIRDWFRRG